ncbi:histone-lysine N-methyltransferase, H3 lysine-9 specific SUVH1-like [Abrus precatorius]|uniref:Histone-lysine N-methyltransferase, H3 lysine-9 specific SUVH1-like n=1 Tax=Abrus precatorius TaxID=3816 RepID=A0A8B8L0F9_ABRPR|nr:histone-lysine N-methyltransferase, H3 lysine-9 specific SUVH1-like [Abrus precatorius]XP_027349734.1 histone-lysine N-methyltransferase, H3 lysine-9 specific SUVH1-like [Abrus precatorius]XP_027349735.1 histone-lysine N-methyltransferase, H3 lysine-9 specific SUVH1-like [Abrus precatorius]XP_027349736.1 histone-lysine N-methyltransferase, H3 lysine-9 specific SUVH1-like [Abrus precatorius]XP_027349737.1 histone-lysine N-methyltransferase, H3 lysine-9 specific SUVH1-like [Abrus precatorius]
MEHNLGQDTAAASGSFDKSRVLNVKPLRTLVPVFPSPSNNPSSSSTPQGGAPFVCASPSGPFPSGVAPFYPFFISPESQRLSEQNAQTPTGQRVAANPISSAVPINSFKKPTGAANGDAGSSRRNARTRRQVAEEVGYGNDEMVDVGAEDGTGDRRLTRKSHKKAKGQQTGGSVDVDPDAVVNDILKTLNPIVFDVLNQPEGGKDSVAYTLMIYEVLRRKLGQIDDSTRDVGSGAKRPDLKAGTLMMSKGVRTNSKKRIGAVPGIEIGDIFFFRFELCLVGLHAPSMAGIDYIGSKTTQEEEPLAVSIVSSGGYEDNVEDGDVLIYSGQGGVNRDKGASDQKLERGNLALERSLHRGNDVRVIRGMRDVQHPTGKVYVYDGLYKIQNSWVEKSKSGFNVFKYKLVRLPGQPQAYMIWKSIQQWTEKSASRAGVILPDLTSGAENVPVCLVNDIDNEKGPAYFTYIPTLKNLRPTAPVESSVGCSCVGGCQPGSYNCSCIQKNGGYLPYSAASLLADLESVVYECGHSCQCPSNCRNRVSQTGLKLRLEVFKTKDRGWGLRSWDSIRAGTFICEYAGEVIDNARVEELGGDNEDDYIFDSTRIYQQLEVFPGDTEAPKIPSPLYISARNEGNVARFMNHSCSPNVLWRPVIRENKNESDLHIAFYAIRHIPPMMELTYDYGIVLPLKVGQKKKKCLCGSAKCRGYFC